MSILRTREFSHYHKPTPYDSVDVYRVLKMFEVTDPCVQHAVKKLLCAGQRGTKDFREDIRQAVVTLQRGLEMIDEDARLER